MNTQVEAAIFIDEKSSDKTFGQFSIKFLQMKTYRTLFLLACRWKCQRELDFKDLNLMAMNLINPALFT